MHAVYTLLKQGDDDRLPLAAGPDATSRQLVFLSNLEAPSPGCMPTWRVRYQDLHTGVEAELRAHFVVIVAESGAIFDSPSRSSGPDAFAWLPEGARPLSPAGGSVGRVLPAAAATATELMAAAGVTVLGSGKRTAQESPFGRLGGFAFGHSADLTTNGMPYHPRSLRDRCGCQGYRMRDNSATRRG